MIAERLVDFKEKSGFLDLLEPQYIIVLLPYVRDFKPSESLRIVHNCRINGASFEDVLIVEDFPRSDRLA